MYEPIHTPPDHMRPWGLNIKEPFIRDENPGHFALVDVRPCGIEQHHTVQVINQDHRPVETSVIFGYGTGPVAHLPIRRSMWFGAPAVIKGNHQYAFNGFAKHTLGEGGESIWVHHVDRSGIVKYPSVIVESCNWINVGQGGMNEHNGVHLTFMLTLKGYTPLSERVAKLEQRVERLGLLAPGGHRL